MFMFLAIDWGRRYGFLMTCNYSECNKPIRDEDLYIEHGMKFCDTHGTEIDTIIEKFDEDEDSAKKFIQFWVLSKGGSKRLAGINDI